MAITYDDRSIMLASAPMDLRRFWDSRYAVVGWACGLELNDFSAIRYGSCLPARSSVWQKVRVAMAFIWPALVIA